MTSSDDIRTSTRFFVTFNGEMKGPLDLEMIEAFMLSGHYPESVHIRREDSDEWTRHSVRTETSPPPPKIAQPPSLPQNGLPRKPNIFTDWRFILGGILVAFFLIKSMSTGDSKPASRYSTHTTPRPYKPTSGTKPVSHSAAATAPAAPITKPRSSGHATASSTPAETIYRGANGRTYRVPHSEYPRLSRMQSALTEQKRSLDQFEGQVTALEAQINRAKQFLDSTSQYEIDSYNEKIDRYNRATQQLSRQTDAFNSDVDSFNADLARVGTPTR